MRSHNACLVGDLSKFITKQSNRREGPCFLACCCMRFASPVLQLVSLILEYVMAEENQRAHALPALLGWWSLPRPVLMPVASHRSKATRDTTAPR